MMAETTTDVLVAAYQDIETAAAVRSGRRDAIRGDA
jgi:hypothetical protein